MFPFVLLSWLAKSGAEEDSDLLREIAAQNEQALETLYDRYSKPLYSILMAILKNPEDAQDLLQEIFVQVWQKAPSFDVSRGNVYTWIVALTRNRAIDKIRSKGFRERKHEDYDFDIDSIEAQCFPTPLDAVLVQEREEIVRHALSKISVDQQVVLTMAYSEGHSQSEIADLLRIPLGTVKNAHAAGDDYFAPIIIRRILSMKPEQVEFLDQCAALVTGGLTAKESEVFTNFLAHTDAARRLDYSKLVWTAAHLTALVPQHTPPAHVKESLMSRIRAEKLKSMENPPKEKKQFYSLREHEGEWFPHPIEAEIKVKILAINQAAGYATIIIDVPPGVKYPEHHHHGAEECLVLSGDLHVGGEVLGPGDFHHADADSDHGVLSTIYGGRAVLVVDVEDIM